MEEVTVDEENKLYTTCSPKEVGAADDARRNYSIRLAIGSYMFVHPRAP